MKLKFVTLIALFFFSFLTYSQYDQGGFISPNDSILYKYPIERVVFIPKKGLIYYEQPNGEYEGKISIGLPTNAPGLANVKGLRQSCKRYHWWCVFKTSPT